MAGFAFTKWYLDCVDPGGRAAIAYWTSLRYRDLSFSWHSIVRYEPGREAERRSSTAAGEPPHLCDGTIVWRAPALSRLVQGY